jgi:hypothetical protein
MSKPVDWFLAALETCYEDGNAALDAMREFAAVRGYGDLYIRLSRQPQFFETGHYLSATMFNRRGGRALPLLPVLAQQWFAAEADALSKAVKAA